MSVQACNRCGGKGHILERCHECQGTGIVDDCDDNDGEGDPYPEGPPFGGFWCCCIYCHCGGSVDIEGDTCGDCVGGCHQG